MTKRFGYSAAAYSSSAAQAALFEVVTAAAMPHHLNRRPFLWSEKLILSPRAV